MYVYDTYAMNAKLHSLKACVCTIRVFNTRIPFLCMIRIIRVIVNLESLPAGPLERVGQVVHSVDRAFVILCNMPAA